MHQAGSQDLARVRSAYETAGLKADVRSYIDDMPAAYAAASVVIARAGATTLAELALFGLPAILIPYPYHKDQHQLANARIFANVGAARIIEEKKSTGAGLAGVLGTLAGDEAALSKAHAAARSLARPEAAGTVASRILCALNTAGVEAPKTPAERK
jgi:UDP-N-acetylglucosamine--N-acetylmuramyl-(pentapeptide) pyrophosphoryl-undecaprenol N-acetylglucosamine transferase